MPGYGVTPETTRWKDRVVVNHCAEIECVPFFKKCAAHGEFTEGKDLPEQNAISPDVTLHGVYPLKGALWCHPLHWQTHLMGSMSPTLCVRSDDKISNTLQPMNDVKYHLTYISSHNIVGVVVDVPGQSKVTNFHQSAFCH